MEKYSTIIALFVLIGILTSCEKVNDSCLNPDFFSEVSARSFLMGFTSWSFGPDIQDVEETYQFIDDHSDIYAEHLDEMVPWNAYINNEELPSGFKEQMDYKVSKRQSEGKFLLSVSILNSGRDNLLQDHDGTLPEFDSISDKHIINAYEQHLDYLIGRFNPDYLVFSIEVNDLFKNAPDKWEEYKILADEIRSRMRQSYPDLPLSESLTLHNWYEPDVNSQQEFIEELNTYTENLDFVSVSFYPFFKGLSTRSDFQKPFDFLHSQVNKPIAFVETNHIAETLEVSAFDLNIKSDPCEQKEYLEVLLENAQEHDYEFVIWWAHRDFDRLWEIFPDEVKDLGKIWRDTGLLDEDGIERVAYDVWQQALEK